MSGAWSWQVLARGLGRGVFPHQLAWILDLPGRDLLMSPRTVADRLAVGADAEVLEVGPGSGHYSLEVARRLPRGRLTLLDVQPEMLTRASARLTGAGLDNHRAVVADGGPLPFEEACFDAAFMVTVLGEVEAREALLAELARVIKPGGVLAITEHHPDPDFEPAARVAEALARHGFAPEPRKGWAWAYTLRGVRERSGPGRGGVRAGPMAGPLGRG